MSVVLLEIVVSTRLERQKKVGEKTCVRKGAMAGFSLRESLMLVALSALAVPQRARFVPVVLDRAC